MTDPSSNIWAQLSNDSSIRIELETSFNLFWIKDLAGRYGFHVKLDRVIFKEPIIEKLKGITIVKGTSNSALTDFVLWLNNKNDWHIFDSLCRDLISMVISFSDESEMLYAINNRLKKWQRFLSSDNSFLMSEQKQMGLVGELLCFQKFIIPKYGIVQSLISWVGPDYHKQDLSLPNLSIEVKTFISSKGPMVRISSTHQLLSENKPLFLFAFGLTKNENGLSICDLINEIRTIIVKQNANEDLFDDKLAEYGYIDGLTIGPFVSFSTDQISAFIVDKRFPKIISSDIDSRILSVEYTIDLSKCNDYKVDPLSVLN